MRFSFSVPQDSLKGIFSLIFEKVIHSHNVYRSHSFPCLPQCLPHSSSPYLHPRQVYILYSLNPLGSICVSDPFTLHTSINTERTPRQANFPTALRCILLYQRRLDTRGWMDRKRKHRKSYLGEQLTQVEAYRTTTEEEEGKERIGGQLLWGMPALMASWRQHEVRQAPKSSVPSVPLQLGLGTQQQHTRMCKLNANKTIRPLGFNRKYGSPLKFESTLLIEQNQSSCLSRRGWSQAH